MNDRGVFLKTVFSAYERFDSVQARIDTDTGSILCQKIVTSGRQHLILNHGSRATKLWREIGCRSLGMESRRAIVPKKGRVRLLLSPITSFGPIVSLQLGWLCETGVRLDVRDFVRFSEVFAQSFAKL